MRESEAVSMKSRRNMYQEAYFKKADVERFTWLTGNKCIVKMEKQLLEYIKTDQSQRILEVGCAEGANIHNFGVDESKFVGMDLYCEKLEFAASRLQNTKFVCADAAHIPFRDNSFDLVFCKDVLHHVENRARVLEEMIRVCKAREKVAIIEANGRNIFWKFFGRVVKAEESVAKNTPREFQRLLIEECGHNFSEITIDFFSTPMFLRLLLHYKFGLKNAGNAGCFLFFFNMAKFFKRFSLKQFRPYIIATGIKR